VDGATDSSVDSTWDSSDETSSTLGTDGNWSISGGDFTNSGSADNSWDYTGSGTTSSAVTATGAPNSGATQFTNIDELSAFRPS